MTSDRAPGHPAPAARSGRLVAALCAVLVAAGGLSGCAAEVDKPGPVLLVGDSIFFLAGDDLTYALQTHGWKIVLNAYPGAGIQGGGYAPIDWPAKLRDLVRFVHPEAVVVELGTNGCPGCPSLARAIDADMRSLRGVDTVMWLTVNTEDPRADLGKRVNAALADATTRWSNLELVRYDKWMKGRTDLVPADNVHPTAEGSKALAGHVTDALEDRSSGWKTVRTQALGALAVLAVAFLVLRPRRSPAPSRR
jgi:hypothetical protein